MKSQFILVTFLRELKSIDFKLLHPIIKCLLTVVTPPSPLILADANAAQLEAKSAPTSVTTIPERSSDSKLVQPLTKWAPID